MQSISTFAAAVTTYIVAYISIFYTSAIENYSTIAAVLGFILLLARLVQEIPRAYRVIFPKKKDYDDT